MCAAVCATAPEAPAGSAYGGNSAISIGAGELPAFGEEFGLASPGGYLGELESVRTEATGSGRETAHFSSHAIEEAIRCSLYRCYAR